MSTEPRLPQPFDRDMKVLVMAGSNQLSPRQQERHERRIASGQPEVPLQDKAFVPLRGRLVIEYVLDSLEALGLHRIWVLGRQRCLERLPASHDVQRLPQRPGATVGTNLGAAYAAIAPDPDEHVLVVFGDHPLTTPAAIADFLAGCASQLEEADFFHAVARTEAYAEFSRVSRRTSAFLREFSGRATGLNLAVPSRFHRFRVFDHMYSVRKQEQFGRFAALIARAFYLLGPKAPFAILDAIRLHLAKECQKLSRRGGALARLGRGGTGLLRRQVPAARVETYLARVLKLERGFRFVPLDHGGTAIDVDFAEELDALERHWDDLVAVAARQGRENRDREGAEGTPAEDQPSGTSSSSRYAVR